MDLVWRSLISSALHNLLQPHSHWVPEVCAPQGLNYRHEQDASQRAGFRVFSRLLHMPCPHCLPSHSYTPLSGSLINHHLLQEAHPDHSPKEELGAAPWFPLTGLCAAWSRYSPPLL